MNKTTLKNHVKNRMDEKADKLRARLNSIAEKYAHKFMNMYLDHKKLQVAEQTLASYLEQVQQATGGIGSGNIPNFNYHTSHMINLDDKLKTTLKSAFHYAAQTGPSVWQITNLKDDMRPNVYTYLIERAESIHEEYGLKLQQFESLKNELLGVITAAPTAKDAINALTELGIDLSDLKEDPKLPAVVKVTQPVCLFNGDC